MCRYRFAWFFLLLTALLVEPCPSAAADLPAADAEGFVPLLSGEDLSGWYKLLDRHEKDDDPTGIIQVAGGVVTMYKDAPAGTEQPYGSLETDAEFSDYDFRLEYRWGIKEFLPFRAARKRDAGILYHCFGPDGLVGPWPRSNEFQIQEGDTGDITGVMIRYTTTVDPKLGGDGSLTSPAKFLEAADGGVSRTFGAAKEMTVISKRGEFEVPGWNALELQVRGDAAVYLVNGHVVNRVSAMMRPADDDLTKMIPLTKGKILIEAEGAEVQYRNIRIRQVSGSPAPKSAAAATPQRRVLYNLDGDSCLWTRKGGTEPVVIAAGDLKTLIDEIAYPGSQVDTFLVCINAQTTYYPTKIGDRRGTLSSPEDRAKWPAWEEQRFRNIEAMFAAGDDPYALLLAEAKRRGLESLLTYRMNDIHDMECMKCKLWQEHPEYRLPYLFNTWPGVRPGLDFGQQAVRDYTFRLIEEAVGRYDCDGIELDFVRAPTYFQKGTEQGQMATMNELIGRVRKMLDVEGQKRGRHLVLAARVLSGYQECKDVGLDPVAWAKQGWIDFLTVSPYSGTRYDLSAKPWKELIPNLPIYAAADSAGPAENYRLAAQQFWKAGADGIYLFNFFTPREVFVEPPYEVLGELGDPQKLSAAR